MSAFELPEGWTPGPWSAGESWRPPIGFGPHEGVNRSGDVFWGYYITGSNEHGGSILPTLGSVHNFPDQCKANAALIALAPAMAAEIRRLERENAALLLGRSVLDDAYTGWVCARATGNSAVEHIYAQKMSTTVFDFISTTRPADPLEGEPLDLIGEQNE